MKKIVYSIINFLLQFKRFRKLVTILNWEKTAYVETLICQEISPDNKVLTGPFKGMVYAELKSTGSPLLPKILGSYEDELHDIFAKIIPYRYNTVIDVGCAEGYYAVGLAMRLPAATVYAFDTDEVGLARCKKMAEINKVANRVILKGFCDANTLRDFDYKHPSLVICDCEGYEQQLFAHLSTVSVAYCCSKHQVPRELVAHIVGLSSQGGGLHRVQDIRSHRGASGQ